MSITINVSKCGRCGGPEIMPVFGKPGVKQRPVCYHCLPENGHRFDLDAFEVGFILAAIRSFSATVDEGVAARVEDLKRRLEAARAENIEAAKEA